jgi:DNA polymerase I
MEKRFLLIDATGLIFRAYYSVTPLTSPAGEPVNAVFGLMRMLLKLYRELPASASAIVFDAGAKTFRNELYSAYKANRSAPPDDLRSQFSLAIDTARDTLAPVLVEPGFEADDIIATLAERSLHSGHEVAVLSSDRDLLQLLRPGLTVLTPQRDGGFKVNSEQSFLDDYGFTIDRFLDYKALMGDPSDNIPGVPGIGEKTAAKLVTTHGKLEQLYANIDYVKPPSVQLKLKAARKDVFMYRELVTLRTDTASSYDHSARTMPDFSNPALQARLAGFGFSRLTADANTLGDLQHSMK